MIVELALMFVSHHCPCWCELPVTTTTTVSPSTTTTTSFRDDSAVPAPISPPTAPPPVAPVIDQPVVVERPPAMTYHSDPPPVPVPLLYIPPAAQPLRLSRLPHTGSGTLPWAGGFLALGGLLVAAGAKREP